MYNTNYSSKLNKHLDYIDLAILIGKHNDIPPSVIASETKTNPKLIDQRVRVMRGAGILDDNNKPKGVYKRIAEIFAAVDETTVYLANVLIVTRML